MARNKQITCKICYRELRSDNLKRHLKVHENGKPESNFNSISSSRFKKTLLNEEAIIKKMKMDAAKYMELGRIIVKNVKSLGIAEQSLRSEYKKAMDVYLKHRQNV